MKALLIFASLAVLGGAAVVGIHSPASSQFQVPPQNQQQQQNTQGVPIPVNQSGPVNGAQQHLPSVPVPVNQSGIPQHLPTVPVNQGGAQNGAQQQLPAVPVPVNQAGIPSGAQQQLPAVPQLPANSVPGRQERTWGRRRYYYWG